VVFTVGNGSGILVLGNDFRVGDGIVNFRSSSSGRGFFSSFGGHGVKRIEEGGKKKKSFAQFTP
jgi:hypothetical protein